MLIKEVALAGLTDANETTQLRAVRDNGYLIRFIEKPSKVVQLAAVSRNGSAIRYIIRPSEEVQLLAVNEDAYSISFIKNPSEVVQLAAVNKNGFAVECIKNPSEAVQSAAINKDVYAIENIKNPSLNILNKFKVQIMKYILEFIRDGIICSPNNITIQKLKNTGWPEIKIIMKSLEANVNRIKL